MSSTLCTAQYLNGHPGVVRRLEERKEHGLTISVVSLAELYEGIYYSTDPEGNERDLNDFPRGVSIIGIDVDTCKLFGRTRGWLRATGQVAGDFDLLIGATALQHNLILLSNNRRHFEMIEGLQIDSV